MKQSSAETHTSEKSFSCVGMKPAFHLLSSHKHIQIHVVSSLHKREIINSLEKNKKSQLGQFIKFIFGSCIFQSKRDLIKLDYLANREFYNESVSKCEENKKISSV